MRLAGSLANQHDAATFIDYLLTLGITARAERNEVNWDLWIFDEDQLQRGRDELAEFQAAPQAPKYRDAVKAAEKLRTQRLEKELAARRNITEYRAPSTVSSAGKRPVTMCLLTASCVVYLLTAEPQNAALRNKFFITSVAQSGTQIAWDSSLPEVRAGQWWRLVSPIILHLSITHLVMNMLALVALGTQFEMINGSWRMLLMVLGLAIPSNLAEYYSGTPFFGGMSGVLYGFFGYVWMKARYEPWSGFFMAPVNVAIFLGWFVLCWIGAVGPIANVAHSVGLAMGVLVGYAPTFFRQVRGR